MDAPGGSVPTIIAATIDCNDLEGMTEFWAQLLGVESQIHEHFGFLAHPENRKVTLWLQKVPEPRAGKNRVHLDFAVADLEAAVERVLALGGSVVGDQSWQGYEWKTFADPEGNLFDIMQAPQGDQTADAE